MSYQITSYLVYGKILDKNEFLSKNTLIQELDKNHLSYFTASNEDEQHLILGFCLTENDGFAIIPFKEISLPTLEMKEELENFCKEYSIEFKEEDFKTFIFAHHSY